MPVGASVLNATGDMAISRIADATNPKNENAENIANASDFVGQKVCTASGTTNQDGYRPSNDGYSFDGYKYYFE